jgi:hypothetical protein
MQLDFRKSSDPRGHARKNDRSRSAGSYLSSGRQLQCCALDQEPEHRPNQHALEGTYRFPPGLPVDLHPTCDIRLGRGMETGLARIAGLLSGPR